MPRKIPGYGWTPDLPDQRDLSYAAPRRVLTQLPAKVDLRSKCPPVLDQGELGSCTAHAIANAHLFNQKLLRAKKTFLPSRLFIYYNERAMENTVRQDAGAQIRDGIKSIAKQGAAPESLWPYDISQFAKKPPRPAYTEALLHQAVTYRRVTQSLNQLKSCLAEGLPIVFGFTVYESFESDAVARTGKLPMPGEKESCVGGHAVLAVGYNDKTKCFTIMNSWSKDWGDKGYFYMPYDYMTNRDLADDFWTISTVETT